MTKDVEESLKPRLIDFETDYTPPPIQQSQLSSLYLPGFTIST